MIETDRFEQIEITSLAQLRTWLAGHFAQQESVWIVRYKEHVAGKYISRLDLLDELLCFGWIDGLGRKLDSDRTMQLISPRKQQAWSQTYKVRVAKLLVEGRMQAQGLRTIEEAKLSGAWDQYVEVDKLTVPDDLRQALDRQASAAAFFHNAAPSYRRNVLRWISAAKREPTRVSRISETVRLSALGAKVPQL